MTMLDRATAKKLFTILCFVLLLIAIYRARQVIFIFVLAILFAHLLEPLVHFLQNHSLLFRDRRGPAVVEVYLVSLLLIGCMILVFVPGIAKLPASLLHNAAFSLNDLGNGTVVDSICDRYGWTASKTLPLKQFIVNHNQQIRGLVANIEGAIPSVLGGLALVPIIAIFLLQDRKIITRAAVCLVTPWGNVEVLQAIIDEVTVVLRTYVRTQVILALLSLVFYFSVLLLFRFPHAIALSVLGAILEFIPIAGWLIAAAIILSVGILSPCHWIWVGGLLLIWRAVQDYVNLPRVMGHALQIHPLLSIFGIMVAYEIAGIAGVYLSIPLMAVIGVVWRKLVMSRVSTAS